MLKECCETAVEKALALGSTEAEAYAQKKHVFVAEVSTGRLTNSVERESQGIGIRVIQKKATGFAYSTMLSDVVTPARQAVESARQVAPDPLFGSLPEPRPVPQLHSIYDAQLDAFHTDDLKEKISHIVEPIPQGDGTFQITVRECSIVTSAGISVAYKKSDCSCKFSAARHVAASYCNFSTLDTQAISRFLERELQREDFPQQRVKWDGKGQIILEPNAVPDFIRPLIMAANGRNVVKKNSYLLNRMHERIVSDEISLYDDGCYPNGLFTQPVDGEGIPSQKTQLIEKGVLENFIYDSYYAHQAGKKSTGNALRQGFKDLPACLFTNVVFEKGDAAQHELIADTQHGILVNSLGANVVDPRTPRSALSISRGFVVENGEIKAALHPAILAGNILTMLEDAVVSGEREQVFRFIVPWIKVEHQR
jgi:PmbA protein